MKPYSRDQFLKAICGILKAADWYRHGGHTAVLLLAGTAAAESDFGTYDKQVGGGPALGVFQMEPDTLIDIYENFFPYRPELQEKIRFLTGINSPDLRALRRCLVYQILIARCFYFRIPEALPEPTPHAMGQYWKNYFNTSLGSGTIKKFREKWQQYLGANYAV